jgi:hypothetical protein
MELVYQYLTGPKFRHRVEAALRPLASDWTSVVEAISGIIFFYDENCSLRRKVETRPKSLVIEPAMLFPCRRQHPPTETGP